MIAFSLSRSEGPESIPLRGYDQRICRACGMQRPIGECDLFQQRSAAVIPAGSKALIAVPLSCNAWMMGRDGITHRRYWV